MSQDLSAISVVVPVYQCAGRLPAHLDFIATLSQQVRELIWVITESPDGSCSMAKAAASKLGGKILEVPKGLYEAWNAGIAAAAGEFLYISTVGDVISADGLAALLGLLRKTGADVAFSPPVIYPPSKANLKRTRHWPLFYFEKLLRTHAGKIIPRQKAILMQILAGASGLTGSCASCLFRSSVLKMRPFPLDHHHYGDTAWLYHHLPEVTLAYWPQAVARFEIHSLEIRRIIDRRHIYRLTSLLAQHLPADEKEAVIDYMLSSGQIDAIRDPHPQFGWWLYPAAWIQRIKRNRNRSLLREKLFAPAA
jgi:glycosyltransferase involved in cell wall biosynthesis